MAKDQLFEKRWNWLYFLFSRGHPWDSFKLSKLRDVASNPHFEGSSMVHKSVLAHRDSGNFPVGPSILVFYLFLNIFLISFSLQVGHDPGIVTHSSPTPRQYSLRLASSFAWCFFQCKDYYFSYFYCYDYPFPDTFKMAGFKGGA